MLSVPAQGSSATWELVFWGNLWGSLWKTCGEGFGQSVSEPGGNVNGEGLGGLGEMSKEKSVEDMWRCP